MVLIPTDNSQIKKETLQKLKNLKSLEATGIRRQFVASTSDPEKEKKQKEQQEESKSDLRKKFGIHENYSNSQELTTNFIEEDEPIDEEREKAREARIMAAKVAALKPQSNTKRSSSGGGGGGSGGRSQHKEEEEESRSESG